MPDAVTLRPALLEEYRRRWLGAACELAFAARDHSRALRGLSSGKFCPLSSHRRLEAAAVALADLEDSWRPLVGNSDPLPFSPALDPEEDRVRRLCRHATRFARWHYPKRPCGLPYEIWNGISVRRMRAFRAAARQLDWCDDDA